MLFPELTLCGYPPEDLLLHRGLRSRVEAAFAKVRSAVRGIAVYVGYPEYQGDAIYNSAALLRDGKVLANHRKVALPNYAVFDEKRYFQPGDGATVVELDGQRFGLIICEDVWVPGPCRAPAAAGAEAILVINGSPFHRTQQQLREQVLAARAQENSLPLVYLNMVGGQDELVFDGGSVVVDAQGRVQYRAPLFEEDLYVVELERRGGGLVPVGPPPTAGAAARGARVPRARPRDARLRREERLRRRRARAVRRHRLGVDADDRRRRARAAARPGRHDAVALHVADEPRRRGGASEAARRALRRAVDRADVRDHARGAEGRVRRAFRPTRRKRTSRRAAAACCSWRSRTRPARWC